jgi:hypothetical protein
MFDFYFEPDTLRRRSFYAPSFRLSKLACGWYGVGHTAWREPGNMRGTVVGKKGRFRGSRGSGEVMFRA